MYYRLKDNYILRGWNDFPYAVVDKKTGEARPITSPRMKALELCNGKIDLSMPFISDNTRKLITEAEKIGYVEQCRPGENIKEEQKYKQYPNRYIHDIHWSITGNCNYRCKHCFVSIPNAPIFELPHDKIMNIIDQLDKAGVRIVSWTGGEPFIRKDFVDLIDALSERNIILEYINTNGSLITEKVLNELAKRNVRPFLRISYDGLGCHDWLRGVTGSEEKINRAFELCRDMGFPTSASMVIHKGNCHTLRASVNHLAKLGVKLLKTLYAANVGEWLKRNGQGSMSIEDMCRLYLEYIPHYYEDGMPLSVIFTSFFRAFTDNPDYYNIEYYTENINPNESFLCGKIRSASYIANDGRVLPCTVVDGFKVRENYPTLFEKSFAECISAPDFMKFITMTPSDLHKANEKCRACKFNKHCKGGCRPSLLYLGKNDVNASNDVSCTLFYGGWIKKIVETMNKVKPAAKGPVKDLAFFDL